MVPLGRASFIHSFSPEHPMYTWTKRKGTVISTTRGGYSAAWAEKCPWYASDTSLLDKDKGPPPRRRRGKTTAAAAADAGCASTSAMSLDGHNDTSAPQTVDAPTILHPADTDNASGMEVDDNGTIAAVPRPAAPLWEGAEVSAASAVPEAVQHPATLPDMPTALMVPPQEVLAVESVEYPAELGAETMSIAHPTCTGLGEPMQAVNMPLIDSDGAPCSTLDGAATAAAIPFQHPASEPDCSPLLTPSAAEAQLREPSEEAEQAITPRNTRGSRRGKEPVRQSKRRRTDVEGSTPGRLAFQGIKPGKTKVQPKAVALSFDVFYEAFHRMYLNAEKRFGSDEGGAMPDVGVDAEFGSALSTLLAERGQTLSPLQEAIIPSICTLMWGYVAPLPDLSLRFVYEIERAALDAVAAPIATGAPTETHAPEVTTSTAPRTTGATSIEPTDAEDAVVDTPGRASAASDEATTDKSKITVGTVNSKPPVDGMVVSGMGKLVVDTLCDAAGPPLTIRYKSPVRHVQWREDGCRTTTKRGVEITSR